MGKKGIAYQRNRAPYNFSIGNTRDTTVVRLPVHLRAEAVRACSHTIVYTEEPVLDYVASLIPIGIGVTRAWLFMNLNSKLRKFSWSSHLKLFFEELLRSAFGFWLLVKSRSRGGPNHSIKIVHSHIQKKTKKKTSFSTQPYLFLPLWSKIITSHQQQVCTSFSIHLKSSILMASNKAVLVENTVSKLHYLQFITMGISTSLDEHFQQVQLHLKTLIFFCYQNQSIIDPLLV